ncbi:MAG: hypothetical protein IH594_11420 [Bacteroidales bacterium]|nr:hypothetical protein [Bacteroidales bacterium]
MKKILPFFALLILLHPIYSFSQEDKPDYGIKFSGFVKNDFILDTRQTVAVREGHFLLYPENELLDIDGEDINDRASFNYLSIQSRLTGTLTGPDAFGAKTSGVLEGAFFGATNSDINGFRLRHAFFKLNWTNTELLMGQYWHMMFITASFPGTVSFNTGAPFQFFSRNPQIRITRKFGNLAVAGMAASQRDFSSPGGPDVLRNALLPDLQGQITYTSDGLLAGLTGGYKRLIPRIKTDSNYKTATAVGGFSGQAFLKVSISPLTMNFQATYLQNGFDGLTLGGFAIKTITDPARDYREYTTINTLNLWTDLSTNGKKVQAGLFAAYAKNLGASDELDNIGTLPLYTRGWNIASLYRISPRIIVNSGKTRFAFELEQTGAAYGKSVTTMGIPEDLTWQVNNRFLVAAYYFF